MRGLVATPSGKFPVNIVMASISLILPDPLQSYAGGCTKLTAASVTGPTAPHTMTISKFISLLNLALKNCEPGPLHV